MTESAAIEFRGVVKDYPVHILGYRKLRAVNDVTFQVPRGQVFGLLGPNRAGKTTLVKMLLSLCRATNGQIVRLGRPITDRGTLARVGYMHENHAFPRYLSARDLLEYYAALSLVPYKDAGQRATDILARVGLADRAAEPIGRFSKGMLQRLGLAQALVNDPELLVLDEPSEGLDLEGRLLLNKIVNELKAKGRTVLLISHSLPEVEKLVDRVAVLVDGRLAFVGPLRELVKNGDALEQALEKLYRRRQT